MPIVGYRILSREGAEAEGFGVGVEDEELNPTPCDRVSSRDFAFAPRLARSEKRRFDERRKPPTGLRHPPE